MNKTDYIIAFAAFAFIYYTQNELQQKIDLQQEESHNLATKIYELEDELRRVKNELDDKPSKFDVEIALNLLGFDVDI